MFLLLRRDEPAPRSRRRALADARRRASDEAVTEVIGYVLSFALSAMFLLISLNVFHAARGNTEHIVLGAELKTLADEVAANIVELGLLSQEFPNAKMATTLLIPQSLNGRLYTISATASAVTAAASDGTLTATATTYKTEVLPNIAVTTANGAVGSTNERLNIEYEVVGLTRTITLRGE